MRTASGFRSKCAFPAKPGQAASLAPRAVDGGFLYEFGGGEDLHMWGQHPLPSPLLEDAAATGPTASLLRFRDATAGAASPADRDISQESRISHWQQQQQQQAGDSSGSSSDGELDAWGDLVQDTSSSGGLSPRLPPLVFSDDEEVRHLPKELRHVARAVRILLQAAGAEQAAGISRGSSSEEEDDEQCDLDWAPGGPYDADLAVLEPASVRAAVSILCDARARRALEEIIADSELPAPEAIHPPVVAAVPAPGSALAAARRRAARRNGGSGGGAAGGARRAEAAAAASAAAKAASATRALLLRCHLPCSGVARDAVATVSSSDDEADEGLMAGEDAWGAGDVRAVLEMDPQALGELTAFLGELRLNQSL